MNLFKEIKPQMTQLNTDKCNADENEERDPVTHDIFGAMFEVHRVLVELTAIGLKSGIADQFWQDQS